MTRPGIHWGLGGPRDGVSYKYGFILKEKKSQIVTVCSSFQNGIMSIDFLLKKLKKIFMTGFCVSCTCVLSRVFVMRFMQSEIAKKGDIMAVEKALEGKVSLEDLDVAHVGSQVEITALTESLRGGVEAIKKTSRRNHSPRWSTQAWSVHVSPTGITNHAKRE